MEEKYTGLEVDRVRQLNHLQDENGRLEKLVAELTLDRAMLQDVLRKNWLSPHGAARWSATCAAGTR